MKLTQEQINECRYDGILAGHGILGPSSGLIIQELVSHYDAWVKRLDRYPTESMVTAWLEGAVSFMSGINLEGAQSLGEAFPRPGGLRPPESSPQALPEVAVKANEPLGATSQLTSLRELAVLLRMDRSAARRYVLKLGFNPKRARTRESGYQEALVFTQDQVRQIVDARRADGYC